jgi:arylsulfatase A-like enzyme
MPAMKVHDLLSGAWVGACLAGWACLVEAYSIYGVFPHQTDPQVWVGALPAYLLLGALFGVANALLHPLFFRKEESPQQRQVILALQVLASGATLVLLLTARIDWLPTAVDTTAGPALLTFAEVLLGGIVVFLGLNWLGGKWLRSPMQALFHRRMFTSASVLLALFALVSLLLPVIPSKLATPDRATAAAQNSPNVLLVVLDTVAAGHLGSYGYARETSPRLDQLASEGALFENNYSAAPWTLPSHASIFSGLHPNNHGTGWEKPRLSDGLANLEGQARYDFHTLSEELARLGYDTCGVSEKAWLSAKAGLSQGFESYWDYSEPMLEDMFFVQRVFDRYRGKFGMPAAAQSDKGGSKVVDKALEWIGGNRSRDESRPFFLFMNLNEAHDPYAPPEEFWTTFLPEGVDVESTHPPALRSDVLLHREVLLGSSVITPEQMELYKALYDAEILYQDGLLGRLFDGLEELGVKDDTLIIVTADHGEEFGEIDGRVGHQLSLSDYLLHVPLIVRLPGTVPAGRRVTSLSSTVDIFPTILDVLAERRGYAMPRSREIFALEGVSQLGAMQEDGAAARDLVMAHYANPAAYLSSFLEWDSAKPFEFPLAGYLRSMDVIRTSRDKLYMYSDGDRAYIDFAADPTEQASLTSTVPAGAVPRARFLEKRFDQQMNSFVVARELLTGHLNWFRSMTRDPNRQAVAAAEAQEIDTAGMTPQELEELGYTGVSVGDGTKAEEPIALPPFEKLQRR